MGADADVTGLPDLPVPGARAAPTPPDRAAEEDAYYTVAIPCYTILYDTILY